MLLPVDRLLLAELKRQSDCGLISFSVHFKLFVSRLSVETERTKNEEYSNEERKE